MREEFDAAEAALITRVIGVPREQLNAFGKRWHQALGIAVLIEGRDLLVMASEGERVAGWLRDAGAAEVVVVRRPAPADLSQAGEPGGTVRAQIRRGLRVAVVLKADQGSGALTEGVVRDILTSSPVHPRGIKVRLESGQVGRVRRIFAG
ncbi:MAG TPA: YwbE family protein [Polyangiaceae bacterium]|nr:YwbE family protein [Polyangiaceae bacterium]